MSAPRATNPAQPFRADIQGLRAVAVLSVLVFHLLPRALPGGFVGVDVFFVLSGFLITGLLVADLEAKGRIDFAHFYVRRIKRLLPAATLVLVVVAVTSVFALPMIRWQDTAHQVLASATYVQNWLLLRNAVDYWAADAALSPVTHYWSLSIEEQFYFVWPCLLALTGVVAAKARLRLRTCVAVVAGLVFIASLAYSLSLSYQSGAAAYFSTWTRAWELALGALTYLAFGAIGPTLREAWRRALGWTGLVGLVASVLVIRESMAFPGWVALLPTSSCALLLLAGPSQSKAAASRWLALRPLQWLGAVSYSLYLWHWPLIVLFTAHYGREPGLTDACLLALAALALAVATYLAVEAPLWRSRLGSKRSAWGFALGSACLLASLAAAQLPLSEIAEIEQRFSGNPGAAKGALVFFDPKQQRASSFSEANASFIPLAHQAKDDVPIMVKQGCHVGVKVTQPKMCTFGDLTASTHLALVGDSHAVQWLPAVLSLSSMHPLKVTTVTKTSCPLTDELVTVGTKAVRPYTECSEWNRQLVPLLAELRPTLVITSQFSGYAVVGAVSEDESERRLAEGLKRSWDQLMARGLLVLGIRDSPTMGFNVADCVALNPSNLARCSVSRSVALDDGDSALLASKAATKARVADLSDYICARETCPAVVGGVLVYRDSHHLTATYAKTLAPLMWPHVSEALAR